MSDDAGLGEETVHCWHCRGSRGQLLVANKRLECDECGDDIREGQRYVYDDGTH